MVSNYTFSESFSGFAAIHCLHNWYGINQKTRNIDCNHCLVHFPKKSRNSRGFQELFEDLRHFSQLHGPRDAQPLARLALRGAQLAPRLTPRQRALLAYRLEGLGWCSWEVCEAMGFWRNQWGYGYGLWGFPKMAGLRIRTSYENYIK